MCLVKSLIKIFTGCPRQTQGTFQVGSTIDFWVLGGFFLGLLLFGFFYFGSTDRSSLGLLRR